ncbi:methyl-accepting chemotaxis protein [Thiomicrorhabdus sp. zzn3]|uniref:methyl-accepting chemotaxis protein n=1 Tax=Thiomicrorhabdus sp. zzn3 TaxID=3039775 RepID=UPI002436C6E2|nr:PAS domain-containing methyl-accepting chemotaxis protein [Thiomicrorhabdus sp. zzn3]MDG6778299.1 methyl-accepting chemotaxis protein [Thiomicrorhabdus sp. zzn3]
MRNNLPVIDEEYQVLDGQTLVSKTDLSGTIIECNDAFEAASGYTRSELIGQPHNLIRHPDVPPAVFEDMWRDLKSGFPWTQFVKNRRKNGGFYWVKAQATPLYENGKIVGYMSVRSRISDAEKKAASEAYKALQSGQLKIKHGQLYRGVNWRKFNVFARLSPAAILFALTFVLAGLPGVINMISPDSVSAEALTVLLVGLVLVSTVYGVRLTQSQQSAIESLRRLAGGQWLDSEPYDPESFSGGITNTVIATNLAFLEGKEESAYQLDQARQLKMALDKLQSNVMMADENYNISYLNDSIRDFLKSREERLKEALPAFDLDSIIGANIDIFHKNPAHQRKMLDVLDKNYTANIEVAGYHFELSMLPIKNRTGVRTATLVEWRDRTQEVQLLENVHKTVSLAQKGYLGDRIDLSKVEGVAQELSASINELLDAIQLAMNDVTTVTTGMANGDLTRLIERDYEGDLGDLKTAINTSISKLHGIVAVAVEASRVVGEAAKEVSQGSHDLSDRVQQQAAALEQTSATMDQMNSTIQHNTENSNRAAEVALSVQKEAEHGSSVMARTIEAMEAIQDSSHKIADIVTLIDGIAFQTNLLALNAAVEAARAGEHGRGFAVVAGEVRNLAQKSAEAARDIKRLIEESVARIDQGTELASQSGEVLGEITQSVNEVAAMINEIAKASNEQAQGISQVHDAITSIDQATQQNAALVEETTAASENLSEQAVILSEDMAFFKTAVPSPNQSASLPGHSQVSVPQIEDKANTQSSSAISVSGTEVPTGGEHKKSAVAEVEWSEF